MELFSYLTIDLSRQKYNIKLYFKEDFLQKTTVFSRFRHMETGFKRLAYEGYRDWLNCRIWIEINYPYFKLYHTYIQMSIAYSKLF